MEKILSVQKTFYKVADFISWKKKKSLTLSPYFQRRPVWDKGAKSFLIDTICRGLPIPIIFIRDRGVDTKTFEPIREVIDGQQRLRTVISYIAPELLEDYSPKRDEFIVKKTHNKDLAGLKFKDLDADTQQTLLNYEFNVHILPANVDDRDVIQIFRRMNSTNFILKKQELLNAQYFGEFKTSQYQLAAEQLERWRDWKIFTEDDISRMQEVEMTSELCITMIEQKVLGKSTPLIESYYKKYDEQYLFRTDVENRYRETMDFIYASFPGNKNDFDFYKKTIFYTFFTACYELLYGLKAPLNQKITPKRLTTQQIQELKQKSDRIKERSAPKEVLESTDRRTTNIKERDKLFKYLTGANA